MDTSGLQQAVGTTAQLLFKPYDRSIPEIFVNDRRTRRGSVHPVLSLRYRSSKLFPFPDAARAVLALRNERWCKAESLPSTPISGLGLRRRKERNANEGGDWSHVYSFNSRQRRDRYRHILTGLSPASFRYASIHINNLYLKIL